MPSAPNRNGPGLARPQQYTGFLHAYMAKVPYVISHDPILVYVILYYGTLIISRYPVHIYCPTLPYIILYHHLLSYIIVYCHTKNMTGVLC